MGSEESSVLIQLSKDFIVMGILMLLITVVFDYFSPKDILAKSINSLKGELAGHLALGGLFGDFAGGFS